MSYLFKIIKKKSKLGISDYLQVIGDTDGNPYQIFGVPLMCTQFEYNNNCQKIIDIITNNEPIDRVYNVLATEPDYGLYFFVGIAELDNKTYFFTSLREEIMFKIPLDHCDLTSIVECFNQIMETSQKKYDDYIALITTNPHAPGFNQLPKIHNDWANNLILDEFK